MFTSSCTGLRPGAIAAGVAILLALTTSPSLAQSTSGLPARPSSELKLPVAHYILTKETQSSSVSINPPPTSVATSRATIDSTLVAPVPSSNQASMLVTPTRWEVKTSDITLYRTLERWSQSAGYKLKWDATKNFLIGAPDTHVGTFESALQSVLSSTGIYLSDYPLEACIYANTPPLVRITRQGEQARECNAIEVIE
ncbi:MAG: TcpQ domain-containing protein [Burkholderiales bacterium]